MAACLHDGCPEAGTVPTNDGRAACHAHRDEAFTLNRGSR